MEMEMMEEEEEEELHQTRQARQARQRAKTTNAPRSALCSSSYASAQEARCCHTVSCLAAVHCIALFRFKSVPKGSPVHKNPCDACHGNFLVSARRIRWPESTLAFFCKEPNKQVYITTTYYYYEYYARPAG